MKIIGGTARGRNFEAPKGIQTRPTTARTRESLFGILQFRLQGSEILDLFGGSGAFSFEALSRGAAFAHINDFSKTCANLIIENAKRLNFSEKCTIFQMDYISCLNKLNLAGKKFDIIFLDPPYRQGYDFNSVKFIIENGLLNEDGIIIIEHEALQSGSFEGDVYDVRRYGDTALSFIKGIAK